MAKQGFWHKLFFGNIDKYRQETTFKMMNNVRPTFHYIDDPYESKVIRKTVHTIANNIAKLRVKHVRNKFGQQIERIADSNLEYLLNVRPSYFMSAYDFLYKITTQLLLKNNAFVYIERDNRGNVQAFHPLNTSNAELIEYNGELYIRFRFKAGSMLTASYDDVIHLRRFFNENDIYGESNKPIINGLNVIQAADDSIVNATKQSAFLRGLLKYNTQLKEEDMKSARDQFVKDYLDINDGSGVAALDAKAEYVELKNDPKMVDSNQMKFLVEDMMSYFGVNPAIISSDYTEDQWNAFYESVLEAMSIQFSQEFTYKIFTRNEIAHGNELMFEPNRIQYASVKTKIELVKVLGPMSLLSKDEAREIFNLPALEEGGDAFIQTLNYIAAEDAKAYQLGTVNKNIEGKIKKKEGEASGQDESNDGQQDETDSLDAD